ncbi:MAG: sensor histidine kinase [Cypionkella sp.]
MDDSKLIQWTNRSLRPLRSISFQLMALLSLALLPVGAIAVSLSLSQARDAQVSKDDLLLVRTKASASVARQLIETGLGTNLNVAIDAIRNPVPEADCSQRLKDFIARQSFFTSVRFVGADGMSRCASDGIQLDLSLNADFLHFVQNPVPAVGRLDAVSTGRMPALLVMQPVRDGGNLLGYLALAVPTIRSTLVSYTGGGSVPSEVVVLNAVGTVLASTGTINGVEGRLPEMANVMTMLDAPDGVFDYADRAGKDLRFAKVTLISGSVAAIGVLSPDGTTTGTNGPLFRALFFPVLIWAASLLAAFYAARRLVITPILSLQKQMRRFALGQRNPPMALPPGAALEIQEAVSTFGKLELIVARNEAALALTAEGKILLVREVHHRIKNNLQMISSIISIQRHKTVDSDVRLLLRSLQDRVLSIAAVDQSLYLNGDVGDVRADVLIAAITDRLIGSTLEPGHGIKVTTAYDAVLLHADQIGPLSLLANETVTNALKYVEKAEDGRAFVDIRLKWQDDLVVLTVANSVGPEWRDSDEASAKSGLGMPLIRALCDQLAADCQSGPNAAGNTFTLSVQFRPSGLKTPNPPDAIAG